MTTPIPNCPQEDKPIRDRAWTDEQIKPSTPPAKENAMSEYSARKNAFTADGGPHKAARILAVADGLRRIGEFESAEMLTAYAERIKADEGVVLIGWQFLGTSSLAGPFPAAAWKECLDPDEARRNGYEVRPVFTHPPAQAAQALVDWLMTFNARLIVNGLHPGDARMWMRATDQWDFDADPVAEAGSTWQDFFANPDDDGPVDPTTTAEPVAQGEAEASDIDATALQAAQEIALMWGLDRSQFVAKIQVRIIDVLRRCLAAQPRAVPDGWALVPREPTQAMIDKGTDEHQCEQGDSYYASHLLSDGDAVAIYKAMLAAAPQPGESA